MKTVLKLYSVYFIFILESTNSKQIDQKFQIIVIASNNIFVSLKISVIGQFLHYIGQ